MTADAPARRAGFTLVEVLLAALLGLGALVVLAPLMQHAGDRARTLPDRVTQQMDRHRLRVGAAHGLELLASTG